MKNGIRLQIGKKNLFMLLFLAAWLIAAASIQSKYIIHLMFMATIYAVMACGLNIVVGITGLANMSQAAFFGIGAYTTAILATKFDTPFYLNLLAAALVSMVFGLALGVPTLRLKGFFLSLATIGFAQVLRIVELNWVSLTQGPMGITAIPGARLAGHKFGKQDYIYYSIVILLVILYVTKRLLNAKIGRALSAIKNDEVAAKSLGINITYYKIFAFALSSFFAGLAGSIYAQYTSFVSPDSFVQSDSTTLLCMVILGGSGTLFGPIFGAIILIFAPEILRFADLYRLIFVGIVMIVGIISKECRWASKIGTFMRRRLLEPIRQKRIGGKEDV